MMVRAAPWRAMVEALVLVTGMGLLLRQEVNGLLAGFAFLWLSAPGGIWCVLRARLLPETTSRLVVFRTELLLVTGTQIGLQLTGVLLFAAVIVPEFRRQPGLFGTYALLVGLLILLVLLLRLTLYLWRYWQQLRLRRLVWAMVHAQVLTILISGAVLGLREGINTATLSAPLASAAAPSSRLIVSLLNLFTPLLFFSVVLLPFAAVILLLTGGIAYLISRPITRQVEHLTQMTARLRAGDYAARVHVEGYDELARLQSDFNAMAEALEQALAALAKERDTVETLLQSRRQLLATVSHELRTPVATLRSYLESATHAPSNRELTGDLTVMHGEVLRLQTLLDDLFTLSRSEIGKLTLRCVPADLAPVIEQVVQTFAPLAWQKASVRVISNLPVDLAQAVVDTGRVEQILYNLLHNSLRHTPPGGIIAISAGNDDNQRILIEVQDTGEGIPPDRLPHIWERFYSGAADTGAHAGLGLLLVRELVTAMGGTIEVYSTPGVGTRFAMLLPCA